MAKEISLYTDKDVVVTPFGVDINLFKPSIDREYDESKFVIGLAKGLEDIYGIDVLINAVKIVIQSNPDVEIVLNLAGKGSKLESLRGLAKQNGIGKNVKFLGFLEPKELIKFYNELDLVVVPSRSEAFGVVAIEAQAMELPVIVSNTPGLVEVTKENETSLVFEVDNVSELAEKINLLLNNKELRKTMAKSGRILVEERYQYEQNMDTLEDVYLEYKN